MERMVCSLLSDGVSLQNVCATVYKAGMKKKIFEGLNSTIESNQVVILLLRNKFLPVEIAAT